MKFVKIRASLTAAFCASLLAACASAPAERFYTLLPADAVAAIPTPSPTYTVVVGPVTLPELVDRPQIVVRTAANRVMIAEQARWAEPLKAEIPRVIAHHLGRQLPAAYVATALQRAIPAPDYRISIDILRFESRPGEAAVIEAQWTVRPVQAGEATRGHAILTEAAGTSYDEIAAAHGRALMQLATRIAVGAPALREVGSRSRTSKGPE